MARGGELGVVIEIPGGTEIVSIITNTSVESLNLKDGMRRVCGRQGASNVMIAAD